MRGFHLLFLTLLVPGWAIGQISPPGLGIAKTASWFALALRQAIDSANSRQSVTYFGLAGVSHPDNTNLFQKQAMFIANQEYYHQFRNHWQYSVALSYRRQNEYVEDAPYAESKPSIRQELRLYGRFTYNLKSERLRWVNNLRQDYRRFYTPDFEPWPEDLQLRTRLRTQLTYSLDRQRRQFLVGSVEPLFSVSRQRGDNPKWGDFAYRESRFCLYYSLKPQIVPLVFNLGYMYNLLGKAASTGVHFIAVDVIGENPFFQHPKQRPRPEEYLE